MRPASCGIRDVATNWRRKRLARRAFAEWERGNVAIALELATKLAKLAPTDPTAMLILENVSSAKPSPNKRDRVDPWFVALGIVLLLVAAVPAFWAFTFSIEPIRSGLKYGFFAWAPIYNPVLGNTHHRWPAGELLWPLILLLAAAVPGHIEVLLLSRALRR